MLLPLVMVLSLVRFPILRSVSGICVLPEKSLVFSVFSHCSHGVACGIILLYLVDP